MAEEAMGEITMQIATETTIHNKHIEIIHNPKACK